LAQDYKAQEEEEKKRRIAKNKNHLKEVVSQMSQEPKMFAKTGVAIIKG
jgi:hypothetical protein